MATFAKVVALKDGFQFSELTVGGLYPLVDPGQPIRDLGYDFAIIDDAGDKMPFMWENDIEAEFERVEI